MSKKHKFVWPQFSNNEPSLAEEAEMYSWPKDPPDPDYIYFEDIDDVFGEAEALTSGQLPSLVVPRNKKVQGLHILCDEIVRNYTILSIDGELLVRYLPDLGCYQMDGPPEVILRKLSGSNDSFLAPRDIQGMLEMLKHDPSIQVKRDDFNCEPYFINTKSGVLDWEKDDVEDHSKDDRFTYCIDAQYWGEGVPLECPTFDNFCKTSLEGNSEKRQLLLEIIGYCCSDCNSGKCAFFLKGEPDSGKSVMLEFITRLLGQKQVSNVPLHKLSERFMRAELYGKKLNCAGEITGKALREISTFKSITGGDRIEAERKGKDPFFFTPKCKLLFAGNALLGTTECEVTKAFTNRLVVLLFNRSIPKEKQDKQLLDNLLREKDTIFTLAVQALQELRFRNFQFTQPGDSREFIESFSERGNSFQAFLHDCCEVAVGNTVANKELCRVYQQYCKENGLEAYSKTKLYELLSGIPNVTYKKIRKGAGTPWGHSGIGIKETAAWNNGTST